MNGERDSLRPDAGIFGGRLGDESDPIADPGTSPYEERVLHLVAQVDQLTRERDEAIAELKKLNEDTSDPARQRRALRRLQERAPSEFEQVIDVLYEYRQHSPSAQVTQMMRDVFSQRHNNISDREMLIVMKDLIRASRLARIQSAITRLGLDEAEKLILGAAEKLEESKP